MSSQDSKMKPQIFATLLAFLLLFTNVSDANSFEKESKNLDNKKDSQVDLLGGCWSGSWLSCKNGHNGKLRATFCRINEKQVQAVFVGSFAKIMPFRYKATLDIVHEEEGMIKLRGSQRLGPIMGTFCYEATITGDQFKATYSSKRDCGQWNMTRHDCCCQ